VFGCFRFRLWEADFAKTGNFFSNYEALTARDARALMEGTISFDQFTYPMQVEGSKTRRA
jgi:hypothetical protein